MLRKMLTYGAGFVAVSAGLLIGAGVYSKATGKKIEVKLNVGK